MTEGTISLDGDALDGGARDPLAAGIVAALDAHGDAIAREMTARQFRDDPGLAERFGTMGRQKCEEDARRHLSYLRSAVAEGSDALFADYVGWAKILLGRLGIAEDDLARHLAHLRDIVREQLGGEAGAAAARVVEDGLRRLPALPDDRESYLPPEDPHAGLARDYLDLLVGGRRREAAALILDAVHGGVSIRDVYLHVFQRTQYEIGRLWQMNQMSVAQEHYCTAATQMIMSQLYPQIFASPRVGRRLVAACVGGDLHEIGVRMVADFFELAGWDTYYLGANTPLAGILETIVERRPHALAISATMTYHVPTVTDIVRAVRARGDDVRILVGGYPFRVDPGLWRRVGADGFAADAAGAVALADDLVGAHRAAP